MKNRDEKLGKVESVTTIIVNIGTIVSWIITFITALTLIVQPQPIVIPGIFELGKPYILTFLLSIYFGYLQVLRHFWRHPRSTKSDVESSFVSYLYASVAKLKRPLVLVGFVLIFRLFGILHGTAIYGGVRIRQTCDILQDQGRDVETKLCFGEYRSNVA